MTDTGPEPTNCPWCGLSDYIHHMGTTEDGSWLMKCTDCGIHFTIKRMNKPYKITVRIEE